MLMLVEKPENKSACRYESVSLLCNIIQCILYILHKYLAFPNLSVLCTQLKIKEYRLFLV